MYEPLYELWQQYQQAIWVVVAPAVAFLLVGVIAAWRSITHGGSRKSLLGRSVIAAAAATATDFLAMHAMVSAGLVPPIATFLGCGVGAIVNFSLNRVWVFRASGSVPLQAA